MNKTAAHLDGHNKSCIALAAFALLQAALLAGAADIEYIGRNTTVAAVPNGSVHPAEPASAAAATMVSIRGDGTLLVDGRPLFPVGIRTESTAALREIADAGFNLVLGSGAVDDDYYKVAHELGLFILGGHYIWATFQGAAEALDMTVKEDAVLRTVLENAKDQSGRAPLEKLARYDHLPGVIGWNTNEEPHAKTVEHLEAAYEIFKANSPHHIVATLSDIALWYHAFRNTADVLIVDNYPFRGERHNRPILETVDNVRHGVEMMGGKPVWLMPGLYPPSFWSRNPADELQLRDLRLQIYAGLIAGAKGVLLYSHSAVSMTRGADGKRAVQTPDAVARAWDAVKKAVAELHMLAPIICDGRPNRELRIRWHAPGANGPGPQLTSVLAFYGNQHLLVANPLDVPVEGVVYGPNIGRPSAFDGTVFAGADDLEVASTKSGSTSVRIAPRGAGVVLLKRRPIR